MLRVKVTIPIFGVLTLIVALLLPTGYFGPLTARIRGLFVKHTRTGNPLVDSVAEHQPASEAAYGHYLNVIYKIAPYGLAMCIFNFTDANLFLISYAFIAYYFSSELSYAKSKWQQNLLLKEEENCSELLMSMLPEQIIQRLDEGKPVEPELFKSVTVIFGKKN